MSEEKKMETRKEFHKRLGKEYDLYQLEWMTSHGYSIEDLIKSLREYAADAYDVPEDFTIQEIFNDWESDCGFHGNIWSCFDEWLIEYRRAEYESLFSELEEKYGIGMIDLTEEQSKAYFEEAFALHEREGFVETYRGRKDKAELANRQGTPFAVLRRAEMERITEDSEYVDPAWIIRFNNDGFEIKAYSNEICLYPRD